MADAKSAKLNGIEMNLQTIQGNVGADLGAFQSLRDIFYFNIKALQCRFESRKRTSISAVFLPRPDKCEVRLYIAATAAVVIDQEAAAAFFAFHGERPSLQRFQAEKRMPVISSDLIQSFAARSASRTCGWTPT